MKNIHRLALVPAMVLGSQCAFAHVTLEAGEAPSDSYYKAVFTVPHGCEGAATVKIRVQIPESISSVKPQGRPGWKLATVKAKLAAAIDDGHGGRITEGIREVNWSGGQLPDDQFEEFKIVMKLPDAPNTTLYFPVVQECTKGVNRWIEIPEAGKSSHDYRQPAPTLKLRPK